MGWAAEWSSILQTIQWSAKCCLGVKNIKEPQTVLLPIAINGFVLRCSSVPFTETDSVPLTSQSFVLGFDDLGGARALALRDGVRVRADVIVRWRVINPPEFLFESNEGDPGGFSVLLPRLMLRFRVYAESLTLDEARSRRTEANDRVRNEFAPDFRKHGMILEGIEIGAMDPLEGARPGRID